MDYEPMTKRRIKVTRIITEALQLLQQMFIKLKRLMQQILNTMSSIRWKKSDHYRRPSDINIICALSHLAIIVVIVLSSYHRHHHQ